MALVFADEYTVACPVCGRRHPVRVISTEPAEYMHELLDATVCPCGSPWLDAFRTYPNVKPELVGG